MPASGFTVRSTAVQPSSRMALAWPPTMPPLGKTCAIRMPALRATGGRSLSGFAAEEALISGWKSPNSVRLYRWPPPVPSRSAPASTRRPTGRELTIIPFASMTCASAGPSAASMGSAPTAVMTPLSKTTKPSAIGADPARRSCGPRRGAAPPAFAAAARGSRCSAHVRQWLRWPACRALPRPKQGSRASSTASFATGHLEDRTPHARIAATAVAGRQRRRVASLPHQFHRGGAAQVEHP